MAIPAFSSIPDSIGNTNAKAFADAGAAVALLQAQNSAAHANRVNVSAEGSLSAWTNRLVTVDLVESVAAQKMLTGREGTSMAETIALAQQLMKGAQTTPPPT
jgi:hypothetical protein